MIIFDTDNLHDSKEVDLYTLINNKLPRECLCFQIHVHYIKIYPVYVKQNRITNGMMIISLIIQVMYLSSWIDLNVKS